MALAQSFVPNGVLLYDPSSGANMAMVKTFFDSIHVALNSNMRSDGGSVEEGEAQITLGTMTLGIHYEHPRENYDGKDRMIITAENTSANQFRQVVDFSREEGETQDDATTRWLDLVRTTALGANSDFGLPFQNAIPPVPGSNTSTTSGLDIEPQTHDKEQLPPVFVPMTVPAGEPINAEPA